MLDQSQTKDSMITSKRLIKVMAIIVLPLISIALMESRSEHVAPQNINKHSQSSRALGEAPKEYSLQALPINNNHKTTTIKAVKTNFSSNKSTQSEPTNLTEKENKFLDNNQLDNKHLFSDHSIIKSETEQAKNTHNNNSVKIEPDQIKTLADHRRVNANFNDYIANQYIVVLSPGASTNELEEIGEVEDLGNNTYLVKTSDEEALENVKDIESVEQDAWMYLTGESVAVNDPLFFHQWGLHNTGAGGGTPDADMDAPEGWAVRSGSNTLVAVLDTGINEKLADTKDNTYYNQAELNGKPGVDDDGNGYIDDTMGWDFISNDNYPQDDHSHGTACATILGARGNNNQSMTGIAQEVKIMHLKVLGANGRGSLSGVAQAIVYATDNGAKVLSLSLGCFCYSTAVKNSIEYAHEAGVLVVCAAGNDNNNNDINKYYPVCYETPNVIGVMATTSSEQRSSFSSYGKTTVDVGAPGTKILALNRNGTPGLWSGTSMATPLVAGAVTLYMGQYPAATHLEVKEALMNTVDTFDQYKNVVLSGGRVNLDKLLRHKSVNDLPIPAALAAQIGLTSEQDLAINLTWDPVSLVDFEVDHYNIYRSTSETGSFNKIAQAEATDAAIQKYIDSINFGNQTYFYKISAVYIPGNLESRQSETLPVIVSINPPTVSLTAKQLSGQVPFKVMFEIDAQDNEPGHLIRFDWDFNSDGYVDHTSLPTEKLVYTFSEPGRYVTSLRVYDNTGLSALTELTIDAINSKKNYPKAYFKPSVDSGLLPLSVSFEDLSIKDQSDIVAWEYDFDNNGTTDYSSPHLGDVTHVFNQVGKHQVKLRITDNKGRSSSYIYPISVRDENTAPTILSAKATVTQKKKKKRRRGRRRKAAQIGNVTFEFAIKEHYSPVKHWLIDENNDGAYDQTIISEDGQPKITFTKRINNGGVHTHSIVAVDSNNLMSHPHTFSFVIPTSKEFYIFVKDQNIEEISGDSLQVTAQVSQPKNTALVIFQAQIDDQEQWKTFSTQAQCFKKVRKRRKTRKQACSEYQATLNLQSYNAQKNVRIRALTVNFNGIYTQNNPYISPNQDFVIAQDNNQEEKSKTFRTIKTITYEIEDGISVNIPMGAVKEDPIKIDLFETWNFSRSKAGSIAEQMLAPAGHDFILRIRDQNNKDINAPVKPIMVTYHYPDHDDDMIVDSTDLGAQELSIHYLNKEKNAYHASVANIVDLTNKSITAHVVQASEYGIFGQSIHFNAAPEMQSASGKLIAQKKKKRRRGKRKRRQQPSALTIEFNFKAVDSDGTINLWHLDTNADGTTDHTINATEDDEVTFRLPIGQYGVSDMIAIAEDDKGARSEPYAFNVVVPNPKEFMVFIQEPENDITVNENSLRVVAQVTQLNKVDHVAFQVQDADENWVTLVKTSESIKKTIKKKRGRKRRKRTVSTNLFGAQLDIAGYDNGSQIKIRVIAVDKDGQHTPDNPATSQILTVTKIAMDL